MSEPSRQPLFRPEVLQAQEAQWLGCIRIARPPSFALASGVAAACAAALLSFAAFGEATRKVSLPGLLVPESGLIALSSPQAATVFEVLVREGDTVQVGQPLLRLRADRVVSGGELGQLQQAAVQQRRDSLASELRLAEQQHQQRAAALGDRLRSLQLDAANLQGELEASQQRVQLAQQTLTRFKDLAASGYVSSLQAQQKQEELLDMWQRERNARRNLEATQREQQSLRAELDALRPQLENLRAQLSRQLAQLQQEGSELDARSAWTLSAPQAGIVSSLNVQAGQGAQVGGTLLSLLPLAADGRTTASLQAHLYAPSRTIGFIEAGQPVWLRLAAFPYQKFGMQAGTVLSVSRTPISAQDLPAGQAQALMQGAGTSEPLYRVTVRLARQDVQAFGLPQALKSGMTLDAQVHQERRAIWEWVLEPVLTIGRERIKPVG